MILHDTPRRSQAAGADLVTGGRENLIVLLALIVLVLVSAALALAKLAPILEQVRGIFG